MAEPWHGGREEVFAAMRELGERNEYHRKKAAFLSPPAGTVGVGGADFEYALKAEVGDEYLRALRRGEALATALALASAAGLECVRNWNFRGCKGRAAFAGRHELRRWEGAGAEEAQVVHAAFLRALPADVIF